jgi:hypothetical protein
VTDPDYTAIAVLMDRSGSMHTVRADAEGALSAFVADQRKPSGKCTIRLSDFDGEYRTVYPSTPVADAPDYKLEPRGSTALLDGVGRLVVEFGEELAALPEDERPGNVIVVIQTDGHENASIEWTRERVFALITQQREQYGWEFLFLGAGQDAIEVAAGLGVPGSSSISYTATGDGTQSVIRAASSYATRARTGGSRSFTEEEREAAGSGTASPA